MVHIKQPLTFDEYLSYDDGTDKRYELVDGELVELPPESPLNCHIARFLFLQFAQIIPFERICMKDAEIEVSGKRAKTHYPDLMILSEELQTALEGTSRNTVTRDMPPPILVIEVASPGNDNQDRDYRHKRSEYAARGIPEYWIIDPTQAKITVLTLITGFYEEREFVGSQLIQSQFQELQLTAEQVLSAGR
jgi:Uma2 family endonuclease